MPSTELQEFARALVRHVRDAAIKSCDASLESTARSPVAMRWRQLDRGLKGLAIALPDIVDETVFSLLNAIDQGLIQLRFVSSTGTEVDLTEQGLGELAGWYMGSGGWRAMHSEERFADDFSDMS